MKQPLNISILLIALIIFSVLPFNSCEEKNAEPQVDQDKVIESIKNKMSNQELSWNNGDIPGFMEHYWKSDSLMFIGKSGITYGWQSTLDNYLESYPDQKNMGTLTFENEIIRFVDNETVQVIGKWKLTRPDLDNLGGHYSLIWQKKDGEWVIISDHSS